MKRKFAKYHHIFLIAAIFLCIVGLLPVKIFAQSYGGGSFGGGNYNIGKTTQVSNNTSSGGSGNSAPSCGTMPPLSKPQWLYGAIAQNATTIKIYFTDASGPYDHYAVQYGLHPGKYIYALLDAGGKGTRIVTINALMPHTKYYFQVRPGNGCAAGVWSNEISATTKTVLARNTLAITTRVIPSKNPYTTKSTKGYTVNVGVKDKKNMPVAGARVTMHSTPQTHITDANGIAHFSEMEEGPHQVLIAYNNYTGEESINLSGDDKSINVQMQVQPEALNFSWMLVGIAVGGIVLMGGIVTGLGGGIVYLLKRNRLW